MMDSDGQHNPDDITRIEDMLGEYDMVIGERSKGSFQVKRRKAGKRLIRKIGEYLVEQKLPDYNSGFRGFRREEIARHAPPDAQWLLLFHHLHPGLSEGRV